MLYGSLERVSLVCYSPVVIGPAWPCWNTFENKNKNDKTQTSQRCSVVMHDGADGEEARVLRVWASSHVLDTNYSTYFFSFILHVMCR